jgi:YhgE/Pip-like protein
MTEKTMRLIRHRLAWLLVIAALVMGAVMTASYLGAFLDPEQNADHLPIGIVSEDAGFSRGPVRLDAGAQIVESLTGDAAPTGETVDWKVYPSREAATDALRSNELYAALLVPESYSADLVALRQANPVEGAPGPATLEILRNPASGPFASSVADAILDDVVATISAQVDQQVIAAVAQRGQSIPPQLAPLYGDPVRVETTDVVALGHGSGRGLAPFYFAVVLTLGGFIGTDIISLGVDYLAGHGELGRVVSRLRGRPVAATDRSILMTKLALTTVMAVIAGALQSWIAIGLLGMHAPNPWRTALAAMLGVLAIALLTLVLLSLFGTVGLLIGVLVTTILGVPSAGGVFPLDMVPDVYRWLGDVLPMRYMTDALRSLIFFDGRGDAGLTTGVWVLVGYAVGSAIVVGIIAMTRRGAGPEPAAPPVAG